MIEKFELIKDDSADPYLSHRENIALLIDRFCLHPVGTRTMMLAREEHLNIVTNIANIAFAKGGPHFPMPHKLGSVSPPS